MTKFEHGKYAVLVRLSNAWYGKQYYFLQSEESGIIYSRDSAKEMTLNEAIAEFAERIAEMA